MHGGARCCSLAPTLGLFHYLRAIGPSGLTEAELRAYTQDLVQALMHKR